MVSVIIPAYNSIKTLGQSVEGLMSQTVLEQIDKIIIVDSSDDEESLNQIEELKKNDRIKVITSGIRVMPAKQRNIGASIAKSEVLCFLDSDAYPAKDWVEKIIEAYRKGTRVGGGSYRLPEFQKDSKIAKAQYYLEFNEFIDSGKPGQKRMAPSCNLFCERELFNKAGGFPEIRASEDTLFGLTVSRYANIMFHPEVVVYHIFRERKDHYLNNQVLLGKYIFIYRKLFYQSFYYQGILPFLLFPGFIMIKLIRITSRIIKAGKNHFLKFLPVSGLFLTGLFYWGRGFIRGIKDFENEKETFIINSDIKLKKT